MQNDRCFERDSSHQRKVVKLVNLRAKNPVKLVTEKRRKKKTTEVVLNNRHRVIRISLNF